jgi:AraC-like DNA-binding protein
MDIVALVDATLEASREPVRVAVHRPVPLRGVHVMRFRNHGHLSRAVPDRFGTVLHLAGRSEWTMCGARFASRPHVIDVKMPDEVYAVRARDGVARFQVMLFDNAIVDEARDALGGGATAPPRENALDEHDARVRPLAVLHRHFMDATASPALLDELLCDALASLVSLTRERPGTRKRTTPDSVPVARARALLDAHLAEPVTLDELAAHARLDKFRLCKAFRDEVGLPPHAYVTHRRVHLAQQLLARGLSQAEVAVTVGLYDQSQLHRHFKRIVGMTPGAYARAMLGAA